jgi:hypothetical protein
MKLNYKVCIIFLGLFSAFAHIDGMKPALQQTAQPNQNAQYVDIILKNAAWDETTKIHLLELLAWNFF